MVTLAIALSEIRHCPACPLLRWHHCSRLPPWTGAPPTAPKLGAEWALDSTHFSAYKWPVLGRQPVRLLTPRKTTSQKPNGRRTCDPDPWLESGILLPRMNPVGVFDRMDSLLFPSASAFHFGLCLGGEPVCGVVREALLKFWSTSTSLGVKGESARSIALFMFKLPA